MPFRFALVKWMEELSEPVTDRLARKACAVEPKVAVGVNVKVSVKSPSGLGQR